MTAPQSQQPEPAPQANIGETPAYWTHKVDAFPGPVAQFRMAQLIDLDDRLYENARIVYRFLIGWYHEDYGDALLSMRHISKVMRQRAPSGANVLSHSVVARAIIALLETGWVARTFKGRGRGKGASRYVPVINVLDLASQGKFPEPSRSNGTVEPSCANGTVVSLVNGTVKAQPSHANGTKTRLLDPRRDAGTSSSNEDVSAGGTALGLSAAPANAGFERSWRAYGKFGNKASARREFDKIDNPDVSQIESRAASWTASARPGQKRMPFEKWLAEQKYDEADRRLPSRASTGRGSIRRDITVARITFTESGADLHIAFNDCQVGDAPSAVRRINAKELSSLEFAAGMVARNIQSVRVLMDVDEDDYLTFQPRRHADLAA